MIVSKHGLGKLVRTTAVNANRIARSTQQGFTKPYAARKKLILEVASRYKEQIHCSNYLGSLFSGKKAITGTETKKVTASTPTPVDTKAASSSKDAPDRKKTIMPTTPSTPTTPNKR